VTYSSKFSPTRLSWSICTAFAFATAVGVAGCGTNPEPVSVVCTDFRAGADLSESTFDIEGPMRKTYGAFAQAAGDLAAVANGMLVDVGASCRAFALELGANATDPATVGKLEPETARAWCSIASAKFAEARTLLQSANVTVAIVTPQCTIDTAFQTKCENRCKTAASCEEALPQDRCPEASRVGTCDATCTGSCAGSEIAPATCSGICDGACFGKCGESAIDCSAGCSCGDTCTGSCTGSCTLPPGGGACSGTCVGACSEPLKNPSCVTAIAAPKCEGDTDCFKSCAASGAARAVCSSGSLTIRVDEAARQDPTIASIVAAMDRNLPPIFLAARGRADILKDNTSDLVDIAGRILGRASEVGTMGVACGLLIGKTSEDARKSVDAALEGSKELAGKVSELASTTKGQSGPTTPFDAHRP